MFHQPIPNIDKLAAANRGVCPYQQLGYKTWHIDETQPDVKPNDTVAKCGYTVKWTDEHKLLPHIQSYRLRGDPLIDNVLDCIEPPKDLNWLAWLQSQHKQIDTKYNAVQKHAINALINHIYNEPDWVDHTRIVHGQHIFLRYALPALMSLFNLSLIGGVSAPKINAVLTSTNYLSSQDTSAVYRRLMETTTYVIQLLQPDALRVGNIGWCNNVAVRFLHGQVRHRLMNRKGSKQWNTEYYGIPINQADSCVTLLSFSINVLIGLNKVDIHLTQQEKEDYIYLWRVCGYYLGVDDDINPCVSYHQAEIDLGSYVMTAVQPDQDQSTSVLANTMLTAISKHYKLVKHVDAQMPDLFHVQVARYLLGNYFADMLQLPSTHITVKEHGVRVWLTFRCIQMFIPVMFMIFKFYGWLGSFELFENTITKLSLNYLDHWSRMHSHDTVQYNYTLQNEYVPQ